MKRTAKTAVALLVTAGIAMGSIGIGTTGGATIFGGASGCCRATA